jgi:hypothetical protein
MFKFGVRVLCGGSCVMKRELGWRNHIIMCIYNSSIWKYECGYLLRAKKCGKCSEKSFLNI